MCTGVLSSLYKEFTVNKISRMEVLYKTCNRRWEFLLSKTFGSASITLGDTAHLRHSTC